MTQSTNRPQTASNLETFNPTLNYMRKLLENFPQDFAILRARHKAKVESCSCRSFKAAIAYASERTTAHKLWCLKFKYLFMQFIIVIIGGRAREVKEFR
jgi:hypothetical protein